jgi:hypothetical protein
MKKRLFFATTIVAALAVGLCTAETFTDRFDGSSLNGDAWVPSERGGKIRIDNGRLVIAPKDGSWEESALLSRKAFLFWNGAGVTAHIRGTITTTVPAPGKDTAVFLGFTPDAEAKRVQSCDDVTGLSLVYVKNERRAEMALVLKEAQGADVKNRGDARGNPIQYRYPADKVAVSQADCPFDVTIHLDAASITAEAGGMQFSQKFPSRLTERFWKNGAHLIVQQQNSAGGRATLAIERVEVVYAAESTAAAVNTRKDPPDKDKYPDRVFVHLRKTVSPGAFSVSGYGEPTMTGALEATPEWGDLIRSMGGIIRFPHGLDISFQFWPYEVKDWYATLAAKGERYGTISPWFFKQGHMPNIATVQQMLAAAKAAGVKVNLQLNCTSMYTGTEYLSVKMLPEARMKQENPLEAGKFDEAILARIVANNATLVKYVVTHGYKDTVATWEMDNERWDMPGDEYAVVVAQHVRMLRAKLPGAKVIVCLGDLPAYAVDADNVLGVKWSKALLAKLAALGMKRKINYFAPHIYPYLGDAPGEVLANTVADWAVRNVYRCLDTMSGIVNAYGFATSSFYVTEWGAESDAVAAVSRNDLVTCMATAIATAKIAMAIYSHPRVAAATFHPFLHRSRVSREDQARFSKWGGQSVFYMAKSKTYQSTPVWESLRLFREFAQGSKFLVESPAVPAGVHVIAATDAEGKKYYAVNSTAQAVTFPAEVSKRRTLVAPSLEATSVKYGSYGDAPGDITEIIPHDFADAVLPPYSVNMLWSRSTATR